MKKKFLLSHSTKQENLNKSDNLLKIGALLEISKNISYTMEIFPFFNSRWAVHVIDFMLQISVDKIVGGRKTSLIWMQSVVPHFIT